jgi:hypothetical protein
MLKFKTSSYITPRLKTRLFAALAVCISFTAAGIGAATASEQTVLSGDINRNASLRYKLTRTGIGANHVVQSHAFDERNDDLYSLHVSSHFVGKDEYAIINRFKISGGINQTAVDNSNPSNLVGHQGLAVEHSSDGTRLWSSAPNNGGPGGAYVVRFKYNPNSDVSAVERYKLFSSDVRGSTTPNISTDGRYLIAKSAIQGPGKKGHFRIRIFDLRALTTGGPGDYSRNPLFDWETGNELVDVQQSGAVEHFQSIASDGKSVYVLVGSTSVMIPSSVAVYSLGGDFIGINKTVTIGVKAAQSDDSGSHYEMESLAFLKGTHGITMTWGIASGDSGKRIFRIFGTPIGQ